MSRHALRLLISGYYGAGNLGDEALLAGLLAALHDAPVTPVVASLDPRATARDHGVAAVDRWRGLPLAVMRSDVVLSGGGGLLQDVTSARSLDYYLSVLRLARLLRKPAVVFAQSLGPLSDAGEHRVKRVLRGIPLGLRDQPSLELAARLGLPARSVADTALLLPPCGPAAGDAAEADGPTVRGVGPADDALVLVPRAGYPAVCNVLRELGRRHLDAGGRLRIVLLHPAADEPEGRRLHARLPGAELVVPTTVAAARSALRGAHAIVSGRLHGMVFGATCGVPVAGLAYDPKVAGFGTEVGAPVVPVPSGGEDGSREAAVAALTRFAADPRLDVEAVERLTARARSGVRWLLDEVLHVGSSNAP